MALVLLVRHATTAATGRVLTGWADGHVLDEHGQAQAEAAADRLSTLKLAAVYSSPLERCAETAGAIAARQRNLTVRQIEDLGEVQARAVAAVNELAARHPKKTIAVCSHADVIRLLLAHYSGVHIDLFQRTAISPASVSAVVLEGGSPRILRVNDTGTVADLAPMKPAPRKPAPRPPASRRRA